MAQRNVSLYGELPVGNSSSARLHLTTARAFSACQQRRRVCFFTATGIVTQLLERREERDLERFHTQFERLRPILLDELGYVPFSKPGAQLFSEPVSRAYELSSLILTTKLAFES